MVADTVVLDISNTSGHLECASTTIKTSFPEMDLQSQYGFCSMVMLVMSKEEVELLSVHTYDFDMLDII